MNELIKKLKGLKTYLILGIAALVWFGQSIGTVDSELAIQAYKILAILGGATFSAKINRLINNGK